MFPPLISPIQTVDSDLFPSIRLSIKRDDLLHPQVSGNKYRKLMLPLLQATDKPAHVVSMGGLWSNHLHALAAASQTLGIPATALVRAADGMNSAMLDDCRRAGMQIRLVGREAYRQLRNDPERWREFCPDAGPGCLWLPEGGSAPLALGGVAQLVQELPEIPEQIFVASGTGATLAGILAGLAGRSHVTGVAVFSGADYLHQEIQTLLSAAAYPAYRNYSLLTDFHHGGYAKTSTELLAFCRTFVRQTGIPLEPVYTGKMLYALHRRCLMGLIAPACRVLAIHTGGLQGLRGFPDWQSQLQPGAAG